MADFPRTLSDFLALVEEPPPLRPMFVSQREFRTMVVYCEALGIPYETMLGASPLIVHPDSLRWLMSREALRTHFSLLDGDDDG